MNLSDFRVSSICYLVLDYRRFLTPSIPVPFSRRLLMAESIVEQHTSCSSVAINACNLLCCISSPSSPTSSIFRIQDRTTHFFTIRDIPSGNSQVFLDVLPSAAIQNFLDINLQHATGLQFHLVHGPIRVLPELDNHINRPAQCSSSWGIHAKYETSVVGLTLSI